MTAALWPRLSSIVPDALERPAAERDAFLDAACATDGVLDAALRAEAAALVAAAAREDATGVLQPPLAGLVGELAQELGARPLPERIGPWRITGLLGEGGMSTVYRAARADGAFDREVALKLIRGAAHARRLDAERRILARLEHDGIARLYDGGALPDGAPYLVMELVHGQPLIEAARARPLDARVELLLQVCDAVAYAHRNLVVHRDLKPSNILVDAGGHAQLLDFGIAHLLESDAGLTRTGEAAMTPAYAAPEQLLHQPITTATDVYALGVLLYEVLAGARPYDLSALTASEAERVVCHETPPPPSAVAPLETARRLGDLDTVVMKALEKDPARRYSSAEALADDLRRWRDALPVTARPASRAHRARLFVRRHRVPVLAAAAVGLALAVGLGAALWQGRAAADERDRARTEAAKSQAVGTFLETMLASADPFQNAAAAPESLTVASLLRRTSASVDAELADQPEVRAAIHRTLGITFMGLGLHADATPHLQAALAIRSRLYADAAHPERIQSIDDLALLAYRLEDVEQADSLQQIALDLFRQADGARSPEVATRLARLASNRPLAEAEPLFAEALDIVTEHHGPDAYETVDVLLKHATQRMTFGDWVGADSLFARALRVAERHGYGDALETSMLRTNWSSNAFYLGHYDQAERLLRRALAVQQTLLPDDHPRLAETRSNWSGVLVEKGRYSEAERLLRHTRTVFIREQPAWWARYAAGAELGAALAGQGRDAEAEPMLRENVDAMRRTAGDAHGWTRHFARHLVAFYDSRGRPSDAAPYRQLAGF